MRAVMVVRYDYANANERATMIVPDNYLPPASITLTNDDGHHKQFVLVGKHD